MASALKLTRPEKISFKERFHIQQNTVLAHYLINKIVLTNWNFEHSVNGLYDFNAYTTLSKTYIVSNH